MEAEGRYRRYMKESAWMKHERMQKLKKHQARICNMKPCVVSSPPVITHALQISNKRRSILEKGDYVTNKYYETLSC